MRGMTQQQQQELTNREVAELRAALAHRGAKVADALSHAELVAMLSDCRDRLGPECTHEALIECATVRAAEVAGELSD